MTDSDSSGLERVGSFYSRIARPYDLFASSPLFEGLRRRAVAQLGLRPGDRMLDLGCGTGGNLPHADSRLGTSGTYVGIDASEGMLERARNRRSSARTHFLRGDASDPPVRDGFDGILVTFVNGVLQDPAAAVDEWISRLRPSGRLVLLDAAGRRGPMTPLEIGFRSFVVAVAPPGTRWQMERSPNEVLIDRVEAAHARLRESGTVVHESTHWQGFVRLSAATPDTR